MQRLTYNEPKGDWGIVGMNEDNQDEKMYCVACKLLDYEKTELSPDQVEQTKNKLEDCVQELEQCNALLYRLAEFINTFDIDEAICKHRPFKDTDCGENGRDCKECIIEHFKTTF